VHGVQFHPESIASDAGHDLLRNFLRLAAAASIAA
jgi:anthranilate synthase component II